MTRRKKVLLLLTLITLLVCGLGVGNDKIVVARNSASFEIVLFDKLPMMKEYRGLVTPLGFTVYYLEYHDLSSLNVPRFEGELARRFEQSISYFSKVSYNEVQSDPKMLFDLGGNCQALSLYLGTVLEKNSIPFYYNLEDGLSHMTVVATVGNKIYDIDLSKGVVREL